MLSDSPTDRTVAAIWRIESARLIAGLVRRVGDLDLAEELAQDALVAALEQWPVEGVPDNPGAWLMTVAKRRAIDRMRREQTYDRKVEELQRRFALEQNDEGLDDLLEEIQDDLLRLIFIACHPMLSIEARVAQRITRAKRTLSAALGRSGSL